MHKDCIHILKIPYIARGILQDRILECVAIPLSRGIFLTQGSNQVACIAGRFFTSSVTREAQRFPGDPQTTPAALARSLVLANRSWLSEELQLRVWMREKCFGGGLKISKQSQGSQPRQ